MLSVDQALELTLTGAAVLPTEIAPLARAAGRVLAEDIAANHDSPPFDTSAMDGFAVRSADLTQAAGEAGSRVLPIQSESSAGDAERPTLRPGCAIRINTGAPLPLGADAVVRVEDARIADAGGSVALPLGVAAGLALRRAGDDYRAGQTLLRAGRVLDARAVGLLASLGVARVPVRRRPIVGVMSSGDEIVEPGAPLRFGQIYDSNRPALMALLEGWGAEVHDLGPVRDDPGEVRRALGRGFELDFLVTAGGVSMGTRDFIRPTALELGAEEIVYQVRQRPGKPLFVARAPSGAMMFGLPGNPVSVMVTALVYVRAALFTAMGRDAALPWTRAILTEPFSKPEGFTVFARADLAGDILGTASALPRARLSPAQGSHQFSALAAADGLIRFAESAANPRPGDEVDFLNLNLVC